MRHILHPTRFGRSRPHRYKSPSWLSSPADATRLDRAVAIKVLAASLAGTPEVRERFAREARAISALNHPHMICLGVSPLYDSLRRDARFQALLGRIGVEQAR